MALGTETQLMEENSYAITRFASLATWHDPNTWTLNLLRSSSLLARSLCNAMAPSSRPLLPRPASDKPKIGSRIQGPPLFKPPKTRTACHHCRKRKVKVSRSVHWSKNGLQGASYACHAMDEDGIGWMGGHRAELS
jgi:hypothetical protein